MDHFIWIQQFYQSTRAENYGHLCDIQIRTLGNPGWAIDIKFAEHASGSMGLDKTNIERTDDDWLHCKWTSPIFTGRCGPLNFTEVIEIFFNHLFLYDKSIELNLHEPKTGIMNWLQIWYYAQCDGDWEHCYENVRIHTLDIPGWAIRINLIETALEDKHFEKLSIHRDEDNWLDVWVTDGMFHGRCGPLQLTEVMGVFRKWVKEHDKSIAHHS